MVLSLMIFVLIVAVNKAYKTLENEEGMRRCREIIEEAKERVDEMVQLSVYVWFKMNYYFPIWSHGGILLYNIAMDIPC